MLVSLSSSSCPLPASHFCITFHFGLIIFYLKQVSFTWQERWRVIAQSFTNWNQGGSVSFPVQRGPRTLVAGSVPDAFHLCSAPGLTVPSVSHGVDSSSKNYEGGWRLGTQQMRKELRPENKRRRLWTSQQHCRLCLLRALVSTSLVFQDAQS